MRGSSSSRDARLAFAHRPEAAASSKLPAIYACSSGGSSSRSCTISRTRRARLYKLFDSTRLYRSLYSMNRAVERYTAPSHPTTPLQSYTAYTALYSIYSVLYIIQLYSLYIIQLYTITLCTDPYLNSISWTSLLSVRSHPSWKPSGQMKANSMP